MHKGGGGKIVRKISASEVGDIYFCRRDSKFLSPISFYWFEESLTDNLINYRPVKKAKK